MITEVSMSKVPTVIHDESTSHCTSLLGAIMVVGCAGRFTVSYLVFELTVHSRHIRLKIQPMAEENICGYLPILTNTIWIIFHILLYSISK